MDDALFAEEALGALDTDVARQPSPSRARRSAVLDPSFAERVAVLMRSRPIADGLRSAIHQDWPVDLYDLATLALVAIDLVISRQGFDNEVTPEEAIRQLSALAAVAAPHRPASEHEEVANFALDVLINRPNQGVNFTYKISDFAAEGHVRRNVEFWLLRLKEDPVRGITVLNASSDAINALVGGLEFDVADEQVATEAMLERQLARGAFELAEKSAVKSRNLSVKLAEEIQVILNDTQRDMRTVVARWEVEVPERLLRAREHIHERIETEQRLLEKTNDSLESDDGAVRKAAARIARILEECKYRHQTLHHKVMGARSVFLEEQNRQTFRPPSPGLSVDISEDIFDPFISLPTEQAQSLAEHWLVHLIGPRRPRIPDLGRVISELLDTQRHSEADEESVEVEELAAPDAPPVPEHVRRAVIDIVAQVGLPARTSTLITYCLTAEAQLPQMNDRLQAADLLALAALWCFAPDDADDETEIGDVPQVGVELAVALFGERAVADADGTALTLPGWAGDDLVVVAHSDQFATDSLPVPTPDLPDDVDPLLLESLIRRTR